MRGCGGGCGKGGDLNIRIAAEPILAARQPRALSDALSKHFAVGLTHAFLPTNFTFF
jgi:hypothetical protein